MAIYTYRTDPEHRGARVDSSGTSRKVRIQVETNDPHLEEADVQMDSGYKYGDVDPLDPTKTLQSIEVNRDGENPYFWEMLLEYRNAAGGDGGTDPNQLPPLMRPPEFDWSYEEHEEQVDKDVDGLPICTAAGEGFDPPLTRPIADLVATVTFYAASWDASSMLAKVNTVNSDTWYGWPAGTVRFCAPRARSVIEPPWPACFQITYTFKCRPDGWRTRVLHAGLMEWDGTYGTNGYRQTRQIKSDDGKLVETPWPLDENGQAIPIDRNGQYTKPLVFLEFKMFPEIPFSGFGV